MRNLKRALSLALATVMTLGLMVVGTGAAAVGYDDVTSEHNEEAIEVLQAVGIMSGVSDTDFDPDGTVTRNQMAVIMSQLLNLNYDYYRGTNPFTDVPSWAAPYVAACAAEGVVAGIGDGLYGGETPVTAAQAALMILKALGYFQYQADFGEDWQVATIRQASYIRLFDRIDASAEEALTRNQIAQLVLNALKANMVYFTGDVGITVNGVVIGHNSQYSARTSADPIYDTIVGNTTDIVSADQYLIQLGEELYDGDLKLDYTMDSFGRPSRVWEYDGDEIGTYVRNELIRQEYTVGVTGRDLYDLLGANTVDTYNFSVTIDGLDDPDVETSLFDKTSINRNNKANVGDTGNGVLTQVFVDTSAKRVYISIINTYLAIADADYNERQDKASFDVYFLDEDRDGNLFAADAQITNLDITSEDFALAADVAEKEVYLVNVAEGEIKAIQPAEVLADVAIGAFSKGKSLTLASESDPIKYAKTAEYDVEVLDAYTTVGNENLKGVTYNVYLDAYGYVAGVDLVTEANNYVFITGIKSSYSPLSVKNVEASGIFLDGTMEPITINASKSTGLEPAAGATIATVNSWYTYSVNSSGIYTVEKVGNTIDADHDIAQYADPTWDADIDDKNIDLPGHNTASNPFFRVYGNDETVYLTASIKELQTEDKQTDIIIDDVDSVAVGIDNVDIEPWYYDTADPTNDSHQGLLNADAAIENNNTNDWDDVVANGTDSGDLSAGVYTLYDDDGYIIATVVVGEDAGAATNLVYVHSSDVEEESYNEGTEEWTWTRYVSVDGQETLITEVSDSNISFLEDMEKGQWYMVKYNAEGEVIDVAASDNNGTTYGGQKVLDYDADVGGSLSKWTLENGTNSTRYSNNIDDVTVGVAGLVSDNDVDTVLYHEGFVSDELPYLDGRTLYVFTELDTGFRVAEDVNIVFVQTVDNKETTVFESGVKELENIIEDLQKDKDGNYAYEISAVIEGRATTVVIQDLNETGDGGTKPTGGVSGVSSAITKDAIGAEDLVLNDKTVTLTNAMELKMPMATGDNQRQQLLDALKVLGYDKVDKMTFDASTNTWTIEAVDSDTEIVDTITCDITADITKYLRLIVDDEVVEYRTKAPASETEAPAAGAGEGTGYIWSDDGGSSWTYAAYAGQAYVPTNKDADVLIQTGMVKVTLKFYGSPDVDVYTSENATAIDSDGATTYVKLGGTITVDNTDGAKYSSSAGSTTLVASGELLTANTKYTIDVPDDLTDDITVNVAK